MTKPHPIPDDVVLVAIDVAKARNEVLIQVPGNARRRRLTVLNTKAEHDRLVTLLVELGRPVACGFEATGNYHRPIAWRDTRMARHSWVNSSRMLSKPLEPTSSSRGSLMFGRLS